MSELERLSEKIAHAKSRLPLPQLMKQLGLGEHAKKRARCPFHGHEDKHPSFSVFQGSDGFWHFNCFSRCGDGDEITFLSKLRALPLDEAISLYLEMAGFPRTCSPKSRECHKSPVSPESPKCPEYPEYPVSHGHPMSSGQVSEKHLLAEKDLKGLAARNACTARGTARKRRWQLLRDLKAVELRWGALDTSELMLTFNEWYRLSQPFLDSQKIRDDYLALFLAEFGKVRVPTGEGDTIEKALAAISNFSPTQLPVIPGIAAPPEGWRRIAALHRELSRRSANGIYFLTCRHAAKAVPGLSHQAAYNINLALAQLGVVEII
jgi:CHC2 zinc finger